MISFREVGLTPNRDLLPINSQFPQLHSRLDDGRLSPASVPLGAAAIRDLDDSFDSPSFIYDLDSLDATCHPHAQRAASAVVVSRAFLVLLNDPATTPTRAVPVFSMEAMPRAPSPGSGASLFPLAIPAIPLSLPSKFPITFLSLLPSTFYSFHPRKGWATSPAAPPAPQSPNP